MSYDGRGEVSRAWLRGFTYQGLCGNGWSRLTMGLMLIDVDRMAFGGNTRDLGSFGEETGEITDLHQIVEEVLFTNVNDQVFLRGWFLGGVGLPPIASHF
ncbi:hypothetical protein Tco_0600756 [Tanacetum coccineum]